MQAKRQELQRQLAKARPTPAQNEKRQSEEDLRLLFRRRRRGPGLGDRGPASSFLCCLSRSPSSPRPAARAPPEATQARSERAHSKVAVFSTSHEETSRGAAMTSRMRSVRTLLVKNRLQRGPQNQTPQTLAEAFSLDRQDAEEAARRGPARASLGRDCLLLRSTCGSPTRLPRRPPARAAPPRASWWGGALPPSILTAGSGHALALFEEVEDSDSESRESRKAVCGLRPELGGIGRRTPRRGAARGARRSPSPSSRRRRRSKPKWRQWRGSAKASQARGPPKSVSLTRSRCMALLLREESAAQREPRCLQGLQACTWHACCMLFLARFK